VKAPIEINAKLFRAVSLVGRIIDVVERDEG
jgi:hypothetical protein